MSYTIGGVKILNEYLVLGVFGTIGAIGYASTRGGSSDAKKAPAAPVLGGQSADEESFIKQFIAEAQKESKDGK
ncbi:uncharacterized protein MJAP1_000905 [Malassezia japonica]|uniref:ATP synthase subunit K, mitochondrial n=1 Tax=Malassezia japonica TaxID=223818 RepID=A0AAF0F3Z2_9BASI|nr:uncharacterized protein MJAP1_000905 [Malassezia japonica]WFD37957.1 hypothetical protein MJAP1_000905 [Malassezia japonica]